MNNKNGLTKQNSSAADTGLPAKQPVEQTAAAQSQPSKNIAIRLSDPHHDESSGTLQQPSRNTSSDTPGKSAVSQSPKKIAAGWLKLGKNPNTPALFKGLNTLIHSIKQGGPQAKQAKTKILVGLLAPAFVFVLFINLYTPGKSVATQTPAARNNPAAAASKPSWQFTWDAPVPYPENLRDPTKSPRTAFASDGRQTNPSNNRLVVRGIVYSRSKPSAIVSDRIVSPGQTIYGAKIVNITPNYVEFEKDGQKWISSVRH